MTGAEHYREAERLIDSAGGEVTDDAHQERLTAQVHATLALAAATAYPAIKDAEPGGAVTEDAREWCEVTSA